MFCPQEMVHEHAGPCKFFISCITFISQFLQVNFYVSAFFLIYFPFSYYSVIFFISSFLFTSYPPVMLRIVRTPFRFLILSPLTIKKEVVSCCFCCRFRCCWNKYNLLDLLSLLCTCKLSADHGACVFPCKEFDIRNEKSAKQLRKTQRSVILQKIISLVISLK